jgi:cardiolipin synthase (CMP-forming)
MPPEESLRAGAAGSSESNAWLTIPNVLTVARMVALILFVSWTSAGRDGAALILFFVAGLTDMLDGSIARQFGQSSKIGRLLDPLADKLFTGVSFVVLSVFRRGLAHIPIWVMIAVLSRDVLILFGSFVVYSRSHNSGFKPSVYGKLNTLLEITLVILFLGQSELPLLAAVLPFCYAVLMVSLVLSAGDYLWTGLRMIQEADEQKKRGERY